MDVDVDVGVAVTGLVVETSGFSRSGSDVIVMWRGGLLSVTTKQPTAGMKHNKSKHCTRIG